MSYMTLTRRERSAVSKLVRMGGSCLEDQIAPEVVWKLDQLGLVCLNGSCFRHRRYSLTLRGQLEILQQRSFGNGVHMRFWREISVSIVRVTLGTMIDLMARGLSKRA